MLLEVAPIACHGPCLTLYIYLTAHQRKTETFAVQAQTTYLYHSINPGVLHTQESKKCVTSVTAVCMKTTGCLYAAK